MTEGRPWSPVPMARGSHGAVVAPHHLATAAGLSILRAGGSAVDAAIATNAALAVVMPGSCGIGGDAFWLIWDAASRRQHALNGSGRAAATADGTSLRDRGLRTMPLRGPLTITVPGAVRSWSDAHRRFGRLAPATILAPAIELANDGFPAWDGLIDAIERTSAIVADTIGPGAGFHAVYRANGRSWRPGERIRLPALARTLETLASDGFDGFYDGDLADRQARGLAAAGSPIGQGDLASHRSDWGEPISIEYRGVRVTTHPPNSSGVVALLLLSILDALEPPSADSFGPDGVTDPAWIHLGIEAAKLAMTDPVHGRAMAALIDPRRASRPAPATNPSGGGTVYLGAVDGEGNAVSLIESNYLGFGSGIVDPETGIHYQNRGSYFSLDPDHPNVLEPGKRTLHTCLPGMLFRADRPEPWVVAGSMGGDAQPQIHAQLVSALVDGGVDIRTAVAAPRWYVEPAEHFAPPVEVRLEARHRPGVAEALEALGHPVTMAAPFDSDLGHEHAIELVDGGPAAGGAVAAATDPRSAGLPAVF